jgi:predicted ABC-type ATPase
VFLWLPSADAAVERVAERVRAGGHAVEEPTIRRRYRSGLKNLLNLYLPLADTWRLIDNGGTERALHIAAGTKDGDLHVRDEPKWQTIIQRVGQ